MRSIPMLPCTESSLIKPLLSHSHTAIAALRFKIANCAFNYDSTRLSIFRWAPPRNGFIKTATAACQACTSRSLFLSGANVSIKTLTIRRAVKMFYSFWILTKARQSPFTRSCLSNTLLVFVFNNWLRFARSLFIKIACQRQKFIFNEIASY